jgi:hypothetical protein
VRSAWLRARSRFLLMSGAFFSSRVLYRFIIRGSRRKIPDAGRQD